jgi:mRNA interferase MazF
VNFDPAVGAEIRKARPALVIGANGIGRLPLRLVVPITDWKPSYAVAPWFVQLRPNRTNGLTKPSGADAFQTKSISEDRFVRLLGRLADAELDLIAAAIGVCVGLE